MVCIGTIFIHTMAT
uniref:Uncharacterized protein n=1 Tax=Rhizophora mucronata TaxID=61149 RepID=A0A2P2QT34_RHIMU